MQADAAQLQALLDQAQRASADANQGAGADSFTPDVGQRIDPAGRVTYDFDAHLHARGVDLDAATTASPPGDRLVRWLDANGGLVADVEGYTLPVGDRIAKLGGYGAGTGAGRAILQGKAPGGATGELRAEYDDATATLRAQAVADTRATTILDNLGRSGFLQLDQLRKSTTGQVIATFGGGGTATPQVAVTHNLGAPPFVIATVASSTTAGYCVAVVFSVTASTFNLAAANATGVIPPAGTAVAINWLAWA